MSLPFAELSYNGSVKRVYRDNQDPHVNYFGFTDDYSVFDWGKMPDTLAHKGKALSILGGVFFQQLSSASTWQSLPKAQSLNRFSSDFLTSLFASEAYESVKNTGLKHHFLGWVSSQGIPLGLDTLSHSDKAPFMKVQHIAVHSPRRFTVAHHTLYEYPHAESLSAEPFLIPLEVVFRFGMPQGSSLQGRLNQDSHYAATLGLTESPQSDTLFNRPVVEFFTKLEPKDRFLPVQEAFLVSGLSESQFHQLYDTAHLLALWLYNAFAQKGIELWDGKFEFAWTPQGLMLVDSIGPDELRLIYQGVQLSKEVIRQFYKGSDWEQAVREAKVLSLSSPGSDWKTICKEQLLQQPKPLNARQKDQVQNLYQALVNHMTSSPLFPQAWSLAEVAKSLNPQPIGRPNV